MTLGGSVNTWFCFLSAKLRRIFETSKQKNKNFQEKVKKVRFYLIFADSGTFSALLELVTMEASTATTTDRASRPRRDHHHRRRALNQGGHLLRLSPMSDQGGHPWPPMEGGRPPSHPHHLQNSGHHRPSFTPSEGSPPPAAGTQSGRAPSPAVSDERSGRAPMATDGRRAGHLHTLTTCRQSEQIRRPFRPRMCADVLAYVGAYMRG